MRRWRLRRLGWHTVVVPTVVQAPAQVHWRVVHMDYRADRVTLERMGLARLWTPYLAITRQALVGRMWPVGDMVIHSAYEEDLTQGLRGVVGWAKMYGLVRIRNRQA